MRSITSIVLTSFRYLLFGNAPVEKIQSVLRQTAGTEINPHDDTRTQKNREVYDEDWDLIRKTIYGKK